MFKPADQITIEWTWADYRGYRHRFSVNDSYSQGYPLGFWAGPHAQEFYLEYSLKAWESDIILRYSNTKRGQLTDQMLEGQYSDIPYKRFSGTVPHEQLRNAEILIRRPVVYDQLIVEVGLNFISWKNAGFDPYNPDPDSVQDVKKISLTLVLFYNFDYPWRNR